MDARISVVTLAVDDLERTLHFYRDGLGFASPGIVGAEFRDEQTGAAGAIVMFSLHDGITLCAYPRSELANDAGVAFGPAKSGEFSIGHTVASRADVDGVLTRAETAGATILDKPHDRPWGIYSGYFQDPDGHLWEIIHNPALQG